MPNYKGHLVGGAVAFLIVFNIIMIKKVSLFIAFEWFCFTLLGALFPDIDIKSKGQKIFYRVLLILFIILIVKKCTYLLLLLSFVSLLPLIVRHRGMCHEFWFVVGAPLCCGLLLGQFFPAVFLNILWDVFFFIIGALSHLYLDLGFKKMLKI
jgi:hypothetical protein